MTNLPSTWLSLALGLALLGAPACNRSPDSKRAEGSHDDVQDIDASTEQKQNLCCKSCTPLGTSCEGCTSISTAPAAWNACVEKSFVAKECNDAQCHKDPIKGMVCSCS